MRNQVVELKYKIALTDLYFWTWLFRIPSACPIISNHSQTSLMMNNRQCAPRHVDVSHTITHRNPLTTVFSIYDN